MDSLRTERFKTSRLLLAVDLFGIEDSLAFDRHGFRIGINSSKEAGLIALVASGASDLIDLHQNGVCVAVEVERLQFLNVAALFSFAPKLLTTPTIVADSLGAQSFLISLFIHIRQHQYDARLLVLSDDRDQIVFFKIWTIHVS